MNTKPIAQKCIYCKAFKTEFNKEHIVPVTFGGHSKYLENLVCKDCNTRFNKEFEGIFLKGSGIESFFRAAEGKKGRRTYPLFGDGSYGNRVFHSVKDHFPPIMVLVAKNNLSTPLQLILLTKEGQFRHSDYKGDSYEGNIEILLEELYQRYPESASATHAFLWIRDTDVTVANYRTMRKAFYRWIGKKGIDGEILCDTFYGTTLQLGWDSQARHRMFSKMCLNFLFWLYPDREICLKNNFDPIREFVLYGKGNGSEFVRQWSSKNNPFINRLPIDYDLAVGLFIYKHYYYGIVYIPKIGPFMVRIGSSIEMPQAPIQKGLQTIDEPFALFINLENGQELFRIIDQIVCKRLYNEIMSDQVFQNFQIQ